jgi:hypothetical protein
MTDTIFETVKKKGIPFSNHSSDLYIPVTPETRELISQYKFQQNVTTFWNEVDGGRWYDIPFAYDPWWEARSDQKTMEIAIVESSNGIITINQDTGEVLKVDRYEGSEEDLEGMEGGTFDLEEFNTYWGYPKGNRMDSYDILDLGFTNKDGEYEAACEDHRINTKIARED